MAEMVAAKFRPGDYVIRSTQPKGRFVIAGRSRAVPRNYRLFNISNRVMYTWDIEYIDYHYEKICSTNLAFVKLFFDEWSW